MKLILLNFKKNLLFFLSIGISFSIIIAIVCSFSCVSLNYSKMLTTYTIKLGTKNYFDINDTTIDLEEKDFYEIYETKYKVIQSNEMIINDYSSNQIISYYCFAYDKKLPDAVEKYYDYKSYNFLLTGNMPVNTNDIVLPLSFVNRIGYYNNYDSIIGKIVTINSENYNIVGIGGINKETKFEDYVYLNVNSKYFESNNNIIKRLYLDSFDNYDFVKNYLDSNNISYLYNANSEKEIYSYLNNIIGVMNLFMIFVGIPLILGLLFLVYFQTSNIIKKTANSCYLFIVLGIPKKKIYLNFLCNIIICFLIMIILSSIFSILLSISCRSIINYFSGELMPISFMTIYEISAIISAICCSIILFAFSIVLKKCRVSNITTNQRYFI